MDSLLKWKYNEVGRDVLGELGHSFYEGCPNLPCANKLQESVIKCYSILKIYNYLPPGGKYVEQGWLYKYRQYPLDHLEQIKQLAEEDYREFLKSICDFADQKNVRDAIKPTKKKERKK